MCFLKISSLGVENYINFREIFCTTNFACCLKAVSYPSMSLQAHLIHRKQHLILWLSSMSINLSKHSFFIMPSKFFSCLFPFARNTFFVVSPSKHFPFSSDLFMVFSKFVDRIASQSIQVFLLICEKIVRHSLSHMSVDNTWRYSILCF